MTDRIQERQCPYCKQTMQVNIGLHNWKNLFRKPTIDEWVILFILIMVGFGAWAYKYDLQTCRDQIPKENLSFYDRGINPNDKIEIDPGFNVTEEIAKGTVNRSNEGS